MSSLFNRVSHRFAFALLALLSIGLFAGAAFAQGGTGAITGLITDSNKAVVVGAKVSVKSASTGVALTTETNSAGVYNVPALGIGAYEVRVEAPGFKAYVQSNVVIETATIARVDVALEAGQVSETMQVSSEASLLQPETSAVGTGATRTMLNNLPFQLSGALRDPTSFIRLTPGATGDSFSRNIAGGRSFSSEVLVDGVPVAYNAVTNSPDQARPAYDTIAEFRVEAVLPPAEYGRTSNGVVNMVTRSGGNEFHGNLVALFRNNIFDARRYNARIPDITRQSEFAGSIGGPVHIPWLYNGKDRTFFFANYTGFRRINVQQGLVATVATEKMRRGDFSEILPGRLIYDPLTADANGVRRPFAGNIIPQNRISNFARAIHNVIPLPNAPGLADNYIGGGLGTENNDTFMIKVDHQITEKNKFGGSVRIHQGPRRTRNGTPLPFDVSGVRDDLETRNIVLNDDYFLRPNLVNRFQVGFIRFAVPTSASKDIGLKVPGAFKGGFPSTNFASQGFSALGNNGDFRFESNNNYSLQDSIAWTKGKHNFKFGARYDHYQFNTLNNRDNAGGYGYSQFATSQLRDSATGHAYASFLLGLVNNAALQLQPEIYGLRSNYFGVYAQDDWKLTPKLTMNYGLRWEMQNPWFEKNGNTSQVDLTLPNPGAAGRPGALVFAGEGQGRIGGRGFQKTDFGGLGPRLGFAYQLTKNTVVRAGAGLFYAPVSGNAIFDNFQGFSSDIRITSQDGGLTPVFNIDAGWPAGVVVQPPFISPTLANGQDAVNFDGRRGESGRLARTSQWQLSVQHTFKDVLFEAAYAGNVAHGLTNNSLVRINDVDPRYLSLGALLGRSITDPAVVAAGFRLPYAGFTGTLAQALRPYPQYQHIRSRDLPTGNSTYHALFLKSEKRFANGLQFLVSYTLSKSLTDVPAFSGFGQAFVGAPQPQNQFDRRAEKSFSDSDRPQRLVLSYSYELPWGPGKRFLKSGPAGHILGGFSVSAIHSYQSGGVLAITIPNNLLIFNGSRRPNLVPGVPIRIGPGRGDFQPLNALTGELGDLYLNRAAFAIPPDFTFGTLSRFLPDVRGPGFMQEDIAIAKRQKLGEKRSVEFRADFFNAFNRRNLNNPITDLTNPNFGRITGQQQARVVTFGFRFDF